MRLLLEVLRILFVIVGFGYILLLSTAMVVLGLREKRDAS